MTILNMGIYGAKPSAIEKRLNKLHDLSLLFIKGIKDGNRGIAKGHASIKKGNAIIGDHTSALAELASDTVKANLGMAKAVISKCKQPILTITNRVNKACKY